MSWHEAFRPPVGASLLFLMVLYLQVSPANAASTSQFQHWYGQYAYVFETILKNNCTEEYNNYRAGVKDDSKIDRLGGGASTSALTQPVIACILGYTGEYVKSQLSCAQVLLGVAPTILAILGPRADEMSTLLLIGRRPFLFFILACGSPSVYFGRAFEYVSPKEFLADRINAQNVLHRQQYLPVSGIKRTAWTNTIATVVEYTLAIGAVANIAFLDYELGANTICIIWSTSIFAPLAWGAAGIFNHVLGALTLRTRIRRLDPHERETAATGEATGRMDWARRWNLRRFLRDWVVGEVRMTATQKDVHVDEFPETHTYVVLTWVSSVCIIAHILFGTIVFSSIVFIGPEDALGVVIRYMVSVMVCRMVLMYELAGLRDAYALSHPEIMTDDARQGLPFGATKEGRRLEESDGSQAPGNKRATVMYMDGDSLEERG